MLLLLFQLTEDREHLHYKLWKRLSEHFQLASPCRLSREIVKFENLRNLWHGFAKSDEFPGAPAFPELAERYRKFQVDLPILCQSLKLTVAELTFVDFQNILVEWLRANPW